MKLDLSNNAIETIPDENVLNWPYDICYRFLNVV